MAYADDGQGIKLKESSACFMKIQNHGFRIFLILVMSVHMVWLLPEQKHSF